MPSEQDNPNPTTIGALLAAIGQPALIIGPDHTILDANAPACVYLTAVDAEALRGKRCTEVVHGTDAPPPGCPLARVIETGIAGEADLPMEVHGRLARVSCSLCPEPLLGQPAFLHVMTDLTETRDAEAHAAAHAAHQADLASLGLAALSAPSAEAFAARCAEVAGAALDAGLALVLELRPGRSPMTVRARAGRLAALPIPDPLDPGPGSLLARAESTHAPVTSADLTTDRRFPPEAWLGELGIRAAAAVPVQGGSGDPTSLLYLLDDRPRATWDDAVSFLQGIAALLGQRTLLGQNVAALRQSEARLQAVTEQTFDLITISDLSWRVRYANRAHERVLGYPVNELQGASIMEFVHPEDTPGVAATLGRVLANPDDTVRHEVTARLRCADGSYRPLEVLGRLLPSADGTPTEMLFTSRDVTDRLQAEAQRHQGEDRLHQSQRLEALGQFAGVVAHDFNNLITVMQGVASLVRRRLPGDARVQAELEELDQAARTAAKLNHRLLTFARCQPTRPQTFSLVDAVRSARPMLARLCGEDMEIQLRFSGDRCPVRMDPGQVEQILMNLASNARDALPQGGAIAIQVGRLPETDDRACPTCGEPLSGEHAELIFSDRGEGMPPEIRARAFEPFFSTKGVGKGTGLGLASVHGIVLQNGGHVALESGPGQGTTLRIWLPIQPGEVDESPSPRDSTAILAELPRGEETILLVEDEPLVRRLAARVLESFGYQVLQTPDGEQALAVAQAHDGPIHLLLSDVLLPGAAGPEIADRLRHRLPELAVLYISGYAREILEKRAGLPRDAELLSKPFRPSKLISHVTAALTRARAAPD